MVKIKVTLFGSLPPIKGLSYYCWTISKFLSKKIKVDFIAFKKLYPNFLYPGKTLAKDKMFKVEENENLNIKRVLTYYNPFSWIYAGFLTKTKIVHFQWWSMPIAPIYSTIAFILKFRRKKIILTVHNVLPHEASPIDKILSKILFLFVDKFIVHTENNKKQLSKNFDIAFNKISVIPMGIHNMYQNKVISKKEARKELKIPQDEQVIITFGNIRDYKGVDDLIKAFSIINKKCKRGRLLIVGEVWGDKSKYYNLIKEYNLENKVNTYLNYIPMSDVNIFFSASDIVVVPYKKFSGQSGIGNIAIAYNKPLIVTRTGGLPELVKDRRVIVTPNNPKELAEKILNVLNNKNLIKKLIKDSEELKEKFSWDNIAEKTIKLYSSF